MIPRPRPANPLNWCTACGQNFTSLRGFDKHRVGKQSHLFSEEHPGGRRCLDLLELEALGYRQDKYGRWYDADKAERTREAFSDVSLRL